ncbi:MAG: hypothetical protein HY735_29420 [Verrucomicrobia bacterium]|nr:hypothetical protein [Verrucomicrobiota bacterium]
MISFARQRWSGLIFLLLTSACVLWSYQRFAAQIPRFPYLTGWVLFALMLILSLYNARKKLPFLPAGNSEGWLQFHLWAGLLTGVLFLAHVSFKWPTGWFEGTLTCLYLIVALSGVAGWILSRLIPKRLTTRGGEVLFERIPAIRTALETQVEALVLKSIEEARSSTIADFYTQNLKGFFGRRRNFWPHVFGSRHPLNTLLNRINDLNRYLDDKEREMLGEIASLVRQKDGLDYHYALQLLLKSWLFVHVPLTYSLLLFILVHVVLVFAFSGGAQ